MYLLNQENGDSSSFTSRYELWGVSVHSWLNSITSFFLGIGDHPKVNGSTELSGIGRHSDVLDTLARYGIIGFFFIYMMFAKLFKYLKEICNNLYHNEIEVIILVVAVIATTKCLLFPDCGYFLFFLLPLCLWSNYINRPHTQI